MHIMSGLVIAFATYSRIPMPPVDWSEENRRCALYFLPLVGAVVGGAVWLWLILCDLLALSPLLRGGGGGGPAPAAHRGHPYGRLSGHLGRAGLLAAA